MPSPGEFEKVADKRIFGSLVQRELTCEVFSENESNDELMRDDSTSQQPFFEKRKILGFIRVFSYINIILTKKYNFFLGKIAFTFQKNG
jgi:hypothetical protein